MSKQFAQGSDISHRLRHFVMIHQEMFGMEPIAHEWLSSCRLGLRDFVLMMRKHQIDAPAVDVERVAEILHGHCGALDMPAWASGSDRRFPKMFAGLGRLPQCEVAHIVLIVAIYVHASTGLHAGHIDFREFAVRGKFRDAKVDRAIAGVRESLFGEALDEPYHILDVFGGPGY